MTQFCTRQPTACEVGGQAAAAIGHRAQDGARKLYRIITDRHSPDQTGSIGNDAGPQPASGSSANTLTAEDLRAEWQLGSPTAIN
jgi:hypothetical protein